MGPVVDKKGFSLQIRDREFHKYYDPDTSVPDNLDARSSHDVALTAFAQLGALRLNAKRCMISLFDRSNQYIIAEATQTLSLQSDKVHKDGDGLWLGTCMIPKDTGICGLVVNPPSMLDLDALEDGAECVIPDLLLDERFQHAPFVACAPFSRFYAGVPIRSKGGTAIGSYCVLDDLPRDDLTAASLQFMKDVAAAVMTHLELTRAREHSHQGERMVNGLASFIEGKESFHDSRARREDKKRSHQTHGEHQHVVVQRTEQSDSQSSSSDSLSRTKPDTTRSTSQLGELNPSLTNSSQNSIAGLLMSEKSTAETSTSSLSTPQSNDPPQQFPSTTPPLRPSLKSDSSSSRSSKSDNHSQKRDFLNESLRTNVQKIFGRAANIIRSSIDVDGVVFFDANVASFGGLVQHMDYLDQSDSSNSIQTLSSDDEDRRSATKIHSGSSTGRPGVKSQVLGLSISKDSVDSNVEEHSILESLLMVLLERSKHGGHLWNFDIDGSSYSRSPSEDASTEPESNVTRDRDSKTKPRSTTNRKSARKLAAGIEAESIIRMFPGARCVATMPLWDSHRERWFAGAFTWTRSPNRILTTERELSYLAAFGNNIMAEIAQLDAMMSDKAKSDLLGSISHELRSPLHGIIAGIEILEDSVMTPAQGEVLHAVETCSRTLLDTVDHLLDFSKINNSVKSSQHSRKISKHTGSLTLANPTQGSNSDLAALGTPVDLDALVEEVVDTVSFSYDTHGLAAAQPGVDDPSTLPPHPGYFSDAVHATDRFGRGTGPQPKAPSLRDIDLLLNIGYNANWVYNTQSGAWRRIVMNLFSNSIKYTDRGFIKISLQAEPLPQVGLTQRSNIVLTVSDSGRGMSQKYLQDRLYKPFAQENQLDPGTGLGLSIVRQIVVSLGGTIDLKSAQGVGTEIQVTVTLIQLAPDANIQYFHPIKEQTDGLHACLLMPQKSARPIITDHESARQLQLESERDSFEMSLVSICRDWFGMTVHSKLEDSMDGIAIYLVVETPENGMELHSGKFVDPIRSKAKDSPLLVIVLCRSSQAAYSLARLKLPTTSSHMVPIIECIAQPCAPRKLARAISLCFSRLAGRDISKKDSDKSILVSFPDRDIRRDAHRPRPGLRFISESANMQVENFPPAHVGGENSQTPSPDIYPNVASPMTVIYDKDAESPLTARQIEGLGGFLLVDDNYINLQILIAYMRTNKLQYASAMDGLQALNAYKSAPLQHRTIFMDISMPVMGGLESTRAIRAFEKKQQIPPAIIIVLTGMASASIEQEAVGSGASLFLTKPLRFKELGSILEQFKTR